MNAQFRRRRPHRPSSPLFVFDRLGGREHERQSGGLRPPGIDAGGRDRGGAEFLRHLQRRRASITGRGRSSLVR